MLEHSLSFLKIKLDHTYDDISIDKNSIEYTNIVLLIVQSRYHVYFKLNINLQT